MRTKCHIEEIEQRELDSYDLIEALELFKRTQFKRSLASLLLRKP